MARTLCLTQFLGFLSDKNKNLEDLIDKCGEKAKELEQQNKDYKSKVLALQVKFLEYVEQAELDNKTKALQEQIEELDFLEKDRMQKIKELNQKDDIVNTHFEEIKQLSEELLSLKDLLDKEKQATARLKSENEKLIREIQEDKKQLERTEERAINALLQKKNVENSKLIIQCNIGLSDLMEVKLELEDRLAVFYARLEEEQKKNQDTEKELDEHIKLLKRAESIHGPFVGEQHSTPLGITFSPRRNKNCRSKSTLPEAIRLTQNLDEVQPVEESPEEIFERAQDDKIVISSILEADEEINPRKNITVENISEDEDSQGENSKGNNLLASIIKSGDSMEANGEFLALSKFAPYVAPKTTPRGKHQILEPPNAPTIILPESGTVNICLLISMLNRKNLDAKQKTL
eukprot:TRINITY_DN71113_c0_g1_i1.p3 TRINITY_DN71113_c0_g1~~TRINITY_DN71113_c0_g1_i1.p3  ORF type:complete len:404 (-),score=69.53 TRINITY_DN71113_c0_g1_i1:2306-3517(-)